jgi:hypothetical protein
MLLLRLWPIRLRSLGASPRHVPYHMLLSLLPVPRRLCRHYIMASITQLANKFVGYVKEQAQAINANLPEEERYEVPGDALRRALPLPAPDTTAVALGSGSFGVVVGLQREDGTWWARKVGDMHPARMSHHCPPVSAPHKQLTHCSLYCAFHAVHGAH